MEIWQNDFEKCHSPCPRIPKKGHCCFSLQKCWYWPSVSLHFLLPLILPSIYGIQYICSGPRVAGAVPSTHWERCSVQKQPVYRELYTTVHIFTEQLKIIFPLSFRHILHHIYSIQYLSIGDKSVCFQIHQTIQRPTFLSSGGRAQCCVCRRAWLTALFSFIFSGHLFRSFNTDQNPHGGSTLLPCELVWTENVYSFFMNRIWAGRLVSFPMFFGFPFVACGVYFIYMMYVVRLSLQSFEAFCLAETLWCSMSRPST